MTRERWALPLALSMGLPLLAFAFGPDLVVAFVVGVGGAMSACGVLVVVSAVALRRPLSPVSGPAEIAASGDAET